MMKYLKVCFSIQPLEEAFCDVLSATIAPLGFDSFEYTAQGLNAYIPLRDWDEGQLAETLAAFPIDEVDIKYVSEDVADENWNAIWEEEGFRPIRIGNLVCVHDTRSTVAAEVKHDIVINPCQAFGTGSHATTRLLLAYLAEVDLTGRTVIDAGTGTGILAILCRMRGAAQVLAYDIDEWSVRNAASNAALNGVEGIELREGDSRVLQPSDRAHLLIANINRNILLADMARFRAALLPKGQLLLSGFYQDDAKRLVEYASTMGLKEKVLHEEDGWAMLLLEADTSHGMDV